MNIPTQNLSKQQGAMLLEALISILIFSIGILALVGLQATSISISSDAKYRANASLSANQIIGLMWNDAASAVANSSPGATFSATEFNSFSGPSGSNFTSWLATVRSSLPQASAVVTTVTTINPTAALSGTVQSTNTVVTIKVLWTPPGATTQHAYTTNTNISAQKQIN
jgi:type IV pilus assembly protein PilV